MDEASSHQPWYRRVLPLAIFGSILMWAAQPPLSLWPLAWVAPVPWLLLVRRDQLTGRRPYLALWLAGFIFWLLAIHWIRLPHPALYLGWIALSAYLAFYIPLFVGLSRVGVHRVGVPLWLAAPIVWTGLELARAHVLTGFLMGSLAHTQVNWTTLIQVSDLFGEYGVDFIIMTVAASIACIVVQPRKWFSLVPAAIVLGSALAYGSAMLDAAKTAASSSVRSRASRSFRATAWPSGSTIRAASGRSWTSTSRSRNRRSRTRQSSDGQPLDLVVWPETMFRTPLVTFDPGYQAAAGSHAHAGGDRRVSACTIWPPWSGGWTRPCWSASIATSFSCAPNVARPTERRRPLRYNSAALVDRDGKIVGTYDKIHRVMFGEYIPFAEWLPLLYRITPLTGGIDAGRAARSCSS